MIDQIGSRITALRKSKGMSQSELAKALNVSASTVGMYEQGRRMPSLDSLVSLSQIFEVSTDFLLTGKDFVYKDGTRHCYIKQVTITCAYDIYEEK